MQWKHATFSDLKGLVLSRIEVSHSEILFYEFASGRVFTMYHEQDCCESVYVEDVVGDLDDLILAPILLAEEATNSGANTNEYESVTWTYYKLATVKGYVDIRWCGSSNGYYSESVNFVELDKSR